MVCMLIQNLPGTLPSMVPGPPYAPGAPGSTSGGMRLISKFPGTSVSKARGSRVRMSATRALRKP